MINFWQVGCGKSSLLSALLGDMKRMHGVANVHGRVAYMAQQAWIQNNTICDNITFGKRFKAELYHKVYVLITTKNVLGIWYLRTYHNFVYKARPN
jgi:ABC-type transport system involved in cytochrome bd biosynthesis fused ATPase/permease subunit